MACTLKLAVFLVAIKFHKLGLKKNFSKIEKVITACNFFITCHNKQLELCLAIAIWL